MNCPICGAVSSFALAKDGCDYLECRECTFLFHRSSDARTTGPTLPSYDAAYWQMERMEALRRERNDCLARALELIYLSAIPVRRILDFGCGQGETVNLLRERLGVEAQGIDPHGEFSPTGYLHRSTLAELRQLHMPESFDAIYSIEVFEHLEDPRQVLSDLISFLRPGGKILINTGTREFIAQHDPEQTYIDPVRRGHISIYSLKSLNALAGCFGFEAHFLGLRSYMTILSRQQDSNATYPVTENLDLLRRIGEWFPPMMQDYIRLLFLEEQLRAQVADRTHWALILDGEIAKRDEFIGTLQREFEDRSRWALELLGTVTEQEKELARLKHADRPPRTQTPFWRQLWDRLTRST